MCNLRYLIDDLEHLQQLTADGWLQLEILLNPSNTHSHILHLFCSSCVLSFRQLFLYLTSCISVMIENLIQLHIVYVLYPSNLGCNTSTSLHLPEQTF